MLSLFLKGDCRINGSRPYVVTALFRVVAGRGFLDTCS